MLNKQKYKICALIGILLSIGMTCVIVKAKGLELQKQVAEEVLRFHVLANSDSEEDQAVKMKVKEKVLDYMKTELSGDESLDETKEWVATHLREIEEVAGSIAPAKAYLTTCEFPIKTYGDITFPAGTYEALRIEIGEGKGQNWWCVLYPNLCFIDAVHAVVPEEGKEDLKEVLDDEAYEMVTSKTIFKIKWFFF